MGKIIKNYFYNLSYQLLIIIVPLFTTPYVSRVLQADGIGKYSFANSIVQYFILIGCIGLNFYGQREIAYCQHKKDDRDRTFIELVIIRFSTVTLALILYNFIIVLNQQNLQFLFFIMSIDIIASMFDISWFFQGIEDFKKIVIRNFIVKIVGVILIFTCVKTTDDLYIYTLCHSVTLLLGNLSMWIYIPKLVSFQKIHTKEIFKHLKLTIVLFLPQIAVSIYTILDKTMIGLIVGTTEVAYYEQSQKIIKIVLTVVTSMGTVMLPRIANLFKINEMEKVKEYLKKSFSFTFFLSFPMMFGLISLSSNIVPWFFGEGYDKVVLNMMFISPIIVFMSFSSLMGTQYLLPLNRQKEYTISVLVGTCCNVILNIILITKFASVGAATASCISECLVMSTQAYFLKKDFNIFQIFLENKKYIFASLIMFIPTFYLSHIMTPTIKNSFIITLLGIGIYILILFIIGDENLKMMYGKIKRK